MKPKVKKSKTVFSGFFGLQEDLLERADGLTHSYTKLTLPTHAVVVIAQDTEGRYILNREYRHPTGNHLLGPPGGRLEKGEDPILGGQREFHEETGYWSDEIQLLGCCYPFPGICDQQIFYLWAKNAVKKDAQKLDPFEFIEIELKTEEELCAEILQGGHVDGNLCTALWFKDQYTAKGHTQLSQ